MRVRNLQSQTGKAPRAPRPRATYGGFAAARCIRDGRRCAPAGVPRRGSAEACSCRHPSESATPSLSEEHRSRSRVHPRRSHRRPSSASRGAARAVPLRGMGGAPMNPAPRNHFLVWIVKPSGCHCTDAFGGKTYRRVPTPLRSTSQAQELLVRSTSPTVPGRRLAAPARARRRARHAAWRRPRSAPTPFRGRRARGPQGSGLAPSPPPLDAERPRRESPTVAPSRGGSWSRSTGHHHAPTRRRAPRRLRAPTDGGLPADSAAAVLCSSVVPCAGLCMQLHEELPMAQSKTCIMS